MEKVLLFLKHFAFGAIIIAVLTAIFIFAAVKLYNGHPHGMPGILTGMAGGISMAIYAVYTIVMVAKDKKELKPYLLTAFLLAFILVGAVALLELL